jgi:hypothetical protein
MQILLAPTENIIVGEITSLSADEAAAQTILSVYNTDGFSAGDYIAIDEIGSEISELRLITSVDATNRTLSITVATNHLHLKDASITKLRYNQRKFYRSSTETGTYSHLSSEGSPVNIQVDQPEGTEFEDSSGTSTSWYKATYFNSTEGTESSLDDAVAVKAGDTEHYTSIYKIKVEAGFQNNSYIGSDLVDRYRTEAEAQAEGAVIGLYSLPFSSSPKIFQHIVTLLAAGYLLSKEYGMEADVEVSKTGQRKIDRAEELLEKIRKGELRLVGIDGSELTERTGIMASCSNVYDSDIEDQGEMFNVYDENFNLTDPTDPTASSKRSKTNSTGFN